MLFLDMVPRSSEVLTRALRGYFRGESVYVFSFRVKAKQNDKRCGDVLFDILWLQAKEIRLSVYFNTFRNFNRS